MRRRGTVARRLMVVPAGALAAALLAGCGGDDGGPPSTTPTDLPALWNPCDGLDTAVVDRALGTPTTEVGEGSGASNGASDGSEEAAPDCRFTPVREGGPVLEAGYALFDAGLDEAWRTMGSFDGADVSRPDVARADDARVVVQQAEGKLFVSGFVQTGDLIQTTNVVDPAPFDRRQLTRGTVEVLAALAEHGRTSEVAAR